MFHTADLEIRHRQRVYKTNRINVIAVQRNQYFKLFNDVLWPTMYAFSCLQWLRHTSTCEVLWTYAGGERWPNATHYFRWWQMKKKKNKKMKKKQKNKKEQK